MRARAILPFVVLAGGVLAAASSSILIRLAQNLDLSPATIAAGRLSIAVLLLLPFALTHARENLMKLDARQLRLGLVAGMFLALHFMFWISSLEYTSVASSVALVTTNPLWVALASVFVFRERLNRVTVVGVLLTMGGSLLIALSDSSGENARNALFGDVLALLGAVTVSVYFLIGRELRKTVNTLPYIFLVYTSAAVVLSVIAVVGELARGGSLTSLFAIPLYGWLLLLGLALGPQLLGHTSFNWALRYLSATFVAVAILGEPIGSALLALVFFNESFQPLQLAGFAILLVGIVVAARAERGSSRVPVTEAAASSAD
ncbi:MAG: DMT family transporter [Roseiflexaceae bacterium]|nr:DMT family transporter [Roseiflexaceae bacterium]